LICDFWVLDDPFICGSFAAAGVATVMEVLAGQGDEKHPAKERLVFL